MLKVFLTISLIAQWAFPTVAQGQHPLGIEQEVSRFQPKGIDEYRPSRLHGRFLHITDIHPDVHYKPRSSTNANHACHRGSGGAGYLGAPGTDCDSPLTLVNVTFEWIKENLRDSIDFVIWTGDSARHDNDERIPRHQEDILRLNKLLVNKFLDVFASNDNGKGKKYDRRLRIPIIPTLGNNDIMPHNVLEPGPNRWTKEFAKIWHRFIPEEQHHTFVAGGWFYVEVIPDKLAVFSLNTMFFFDSNTAVDGCEYPSEPGYAHMEWLRVQLQFLRNRNVKAILMGHVPPARSGSKRNWDETCWQKYTLWLRQYRDVIVGSVYGHMNIDHFMFQDFHDVKIGKKADSELDVTSGGDEEVFQQSRTTYLSWLRAEWSKLPSPPSTSFSTNVDGDVVALPTPDQDLPSQGQDQDIQAIKSRKQFLEETGGPWTERYSLSLVSPSLVPCYFPTIRVIEYNITGLEDSILWSQASVNHRSGSLSSDPVGSDSRVGEKSLAAARKKKKGKTKKRKGIKKPKKPQFEIPQPPSSSAPPGPAYSNQPFTFLGYTQYFANLTKLESETTHSEDRRQVSDHIPTWREYRLSKDNGIDPKKSGSVPFRYEVEYDTRSDKIYKLRDMTVRSYLELARRIAMKETSKSEQEVPSAKGFRGGKGHPLGKTQYEDDFANRNIGEQGKGGVARIRNKVWLAFLNRAFAGYFGNDELFEIDIAS